MKPADMSRRAPLPSCCAVSILMAASATPAQPQPTRTFEVASVKLCRQTVGPDYNNRIVISPAAFTARNGTLRRLMAEAYDLQTRQISGPAWLDQNEYDIDGRTSAPADRASIALMIRALLADRFRLQQHSETKEMRVYVLRVAPSGPKIHPATATEAGNNAGGYRFRGDMRRFVDFLAVQFSIPAAIIPGEAVRAGGPMLPVLDKAGLAGEYDFTTDILPEPGVDSFTLWRR